MKYLILLFIILSMPLKAQIFEGKVTDEWGKALANVKITVNKMTIESDTEGNFKFRLGEKEKIVNFGAEKKPYTLGKWEMENNFLFVVMSSPLKLIDGNVSTLTLGAVADAKVEIFGLSESFPTYTNKEGNFRLKVPFYYKVTPETRFLVDGYEITNEDYAFSEKDLYLRITRREGQKLLVKQEPKIPAVLRNEARRFYHKGIKLDILGTKHSFEDKNTVNIRLKDFSFELPDNPKKDGFIYVNLLPNDSVKKNNEKNNVLFAEDLKIPANPKEAVAQMMLSENKSTLLTNEVSRVVKIMGQARLDSLKRVHLQIYLDHLEKALFSTDTSYQNSMNKAKEELLKLKGVVSEKDSAAKIGSAKYEQIRKEKEAIEKQSRRNIIISFGIVLFFIGLTYVSIRVAQNIRKQRNELGRVNRKLEATTADLQEKIDVIEHQKEEINKQAISLGNLNEQLSQNNKKMMDSIRYALTIQDSVLPTTETLTTLFRECFVIYKPKDIVSGDFYWLAYVPQKDKEFIFLAVVDCTGHGVSGAFMSMIGNALLNEIINKKKIYTTASILEEMDRGIREVLRQNETANDDGMDVCLCKFIQNFEETKLIFTGAKRPLFHFIDAQNTVEVIKGDHRSLGGGRSNKKKRNFTEHKVYLKAGDVLYMCSDGFIDQSNEKNEKLGTNLFLASIKEIGHKDLAFQQKYLNQLLSEHQKNAEQRDDISLIGIKI